MKLSPLRKNIYDSILLAVNKIFSDLLHKALRVVDQLLTRVLLFVHESFVSNGENEIEYKSPVDIRINSNWMKRNHSFDDTSVLKNCTRYIVFQIDFMLEGQSTTMVQIFTHTKTSSLEIIDTGMLSDLS